MITITILIFGHWKKGSDLYLRYSQPIFYGLLFVNYLVVPIIVIVCSVTVIVKQHVHGEVSSIESFTVFFDVLMVLHYTEFFTFIRPVILVDAEFYCRSKPRISIMTADQIENELLEEELRD